MAGADVDPDRDPAEARERGRWLFAQPCGFAAGAPTLDRLPEAQGPEIAFAGRSNVGKSSLLNALVGQHGLARTANTPGRTQQIVFFDLGGRLILVDLPGYGFAKVPREQAAQWQANMRNYLRGRVTLHRVCLLVDARRGLRDTDRDIMGMLDGAGVSYRLVLTKADKVKGASLAEQQSAVEKALVRHPAALPEALVTSTAKGWGLAELRAELAALAPEPA